MLDFDREPLTFAIGDTLTFGRYLPDYLPANGWTLLYEVRGGANGDTPVEFTSTTNGSGFTMTVDAATTAQWVAGDYILAGFAVNATAVPPVRHQIYYGEFVLGQNLGDDDTTAPTTHAQRMIALIEGQLEQLAQHSLHATTVERTELIRVTRESLEKQLGINIEKRRAELAAESVANGRPSGNKIVPQFNITGGICTIGSPTWPFGQR